MTLLDAEHLKRDPLLTDRERGAVNRAIISFEIMIPLFNEARLYDHFDFPLPADVLTVDGQKLPSREEFAATTGQRADVQRIVKPLMVVTLRLRKWSAYFLLLSPEHQEKHGQAFSHLMDLANALCDAQQKLVSYCQYIS